MTNDRPQTQDPEELRRQIERTRGDMDRTLAELEDRVSPTRIRERQTEKVRSRWEQARESVMGAVETDGPGMTDRASDAAQSTQEAVQRTPERIESATRGNPLAAGLIALGAGALAASLFPATRPERRAGAELRGSFEEPVRDQLQQSGQQVRDQLQGHAQQAVEDTRQAAQDATQRTMDEAQGAADEVQGRAESAADTMRDQGGSSGDRSGSTREAEPPNVSDLKSDWVEYATTQGIERSHAESLTKDELIDVTTGRRPTVNDLKSEWVSYAVKRGMDPDEAESLTKEELVNRFAD